MIKRFKAVLDGGERHVFATGAVRELSQGKGRFDLLPAYPLLRLAIHYENGARKYLPRNWEKGLPLSTFINSAFHHLFLFSGGSRSEDHLMAVAWNVLAYAHTEEMIRLGRLPKTLADFPEEGPLSSPQGNGTTSAYGVLADTRAVRSPDRSRKARLPRPRAKARARKVPRSD